MFLFIFLQGYTAYSSGQRRATVCLILIQCCRYSLKLGKHRFMSLRDVDNSDKYMRITVLCVHREYYLRTVTVVVSQSSFIDSLRVR